MKIFDNLNLTSKVNDFNKIFYYATYDRASQAYSDMFPARSDSEAERMVADVVNTPKTIFNINRADLELYRVCTYDIRTASIISCKNKLCDLKNLFDLELFNSRFDKVFNRNDSKE